MLEYITMYLNLYIYIVLRIFILIDYFNLLCNKYCFKKHLHEDDKTTGGRNT